MEETYFEEEDYSEYNTDDDLVEEDIVEEDEENAMYEDDDENAMYEDDGDLSDDSEDLVENEFGAVSDLIEEDTYTDEDELDPTEFDSLSVDDIDNTREPVLTPEAFFEVPEVKKESPIVERETVHINADSKFYNEIGEITIMDNTGSKDTFNLEYLNVMDIVVTDRIRKSGNSEWLTKSIKATGVLEPLMVAKTEVDGVYVLLHGLQRLCSSVKAGLKFVPCIVNNKISTTEIRIVEALYNKSNKYSMKEIIDYIDYLEKEKGIYKSDMIEFLTHLNPGDYSKIKDIVNDNDDEIYPKLLDGTFSIAEAFKRLEQRRKKETPEEKEARQAEKVYAQKGDESLLASLDASGEVVDEDTDDRLTEEEIASIGFNMADLNKNLDSMDLDEMISQSNKIEGFEPNKQKVGERERMDPAIRKAALARDKDTCQCCLQGGESYVDVIDCHHITPVFLGGVDSVENSTTLCLTCHRMVHLYAQGDLYIPKTLSEEEIDAMEEVARIMYKLERDKFKRVVRVGDNIRNGMALRGMKKDQLKKEHGVGSIGRNKPGQIQERA